MGLVWRGSTNQVLESPNNYYDVEHYEENQEVEIQIDHNTGEVLITGYPDINIISMVEELTGRNLKSELI